MWALLFSRDSDDDFARSVEIQKSRICFTSLMPLENMTQYRLYAMLLDEGTQVLEHRDARIDNASDLSPCISRLVVYTRWYISELKGTYLS